MAEPVPALNPEAELSDDLNRLRSLLEQGDVEGARSFVKELEAKWPESPRVQHFAHVLAPPEFLGRRPGGGRSLKPEHDWLRAHAREYPGCWLAIHGDRLIAADPDLDIVLDAMERASDLVDPLLHFQPGIRT
jgi:hypothetical protein